MIRTSRPPAGAAKKPRQLFELGRTPAEIARFEHTVSLVFSDVLG